MPHGSQEFERQADPRQIDGQDALLPWAELETLVHLDPAGRGLASYRIDGVPLDAGQLRAAANSLARSAKSIGIITGFCVQTSQGLAPETDGPPGALFLARALATLGAQVCIMTDRVSRPTIELGKDLWSLENVSLVEMPLFDRQEDAELWACEFVESPPGSALSHLIAIERPSPSHTLESLAAQKASPDVIARFAQLVPSEHRGLCHNMRGESIHELSAPTHLLFDAIAARKLPIKTIGIGDGGNEIGMGSFTWQTLVDAVGTPQAARIAACVATDFAIIAGVSNWGAYALALATAYLRNRAEAGNAWTAESQRTLIERLVRDAGAVDGLTRRREVSVDGLPLDVYLQPLESMRKLLGFATE
jgi:hypothetical protein